MTRWLFTLLACTYACSAAPEEVRHAPPLDANALPPTSSDDFCAIVQRLIAHTELRASLTVHRQLAPFRSAKPSPRPLTNAQYVARARSGMPLVVSCKMKAADHLQAVYGPTAAGPQRTCSDVTRALRNGLSRRLSRQDPESAARVRRMIVDPDEHARTGSQFLADFTAVRADGDGVLHLRSREFRSDWRDWTLWWLPFVLRGQHYCHLIAPEQLRAVAQGTLRPGTRVSMLP